MATTPTPLQNLQAADTALTGSISNLLTVAAAVQDAITALGTTPPVVPPVVPPVATSIALTWAEPDAGATVSGTALLHFTGALLVNVEVFNGATMIGRMTCAADGLSASGGIDTTTLPNGVVTLNATAWNAPAGKGVATTQTVSATTTLTIANAVVQPVDPPPPPPPPPPGGGRGIPYFIGEYNWFGPQAQASLANLLGRPMDCAEWYASYGDGDPDNTAGYFPTPGMVLNWAMGTIGWGSKWTAADTASGAHNAYYQNAAQNYNNYANSIAEIRINHEANGGWFPSGFHGGCLYDNNPSQWAQAFRNLALALRQFAPTINICFNMAAGAGLADPDPAWPGDDCVDFVGFDFYDNQRQWNGVQLTPANAFQSFAGVTAGFNWLDAFRQAGYTSPTLNPAHPRTTNKFMSFSEWGVGASGGSGDAAGAGIINGFRAWIEDPVRAAWMALHTYWNSDTQASGYVGALYLYPLSQAAYKAAWGGTVYNGTSINARGGKVPAGTFGFNPAWTAPFGPG